MSKKTNLSHEFWITGAIEIPLISDFYRFVMENPTDRIIININSEGGCVDTAIAVCNVIQDLRGMGVIVETRGFARVMSAATMIISQGTPGYRSSYRNTSFMIHNMSWDGSGNVNGMINNVTYLNWSKDTYLRYIKHSMPHHDFSRLYIDNGFDSYFTTTNAIEIGLIDHEFKMER